MSNSGGTNLPQCGGGQGPGGHHSTISGSSGGGPGPADIPPGLTSSSNLSEEVKMSIRSISSEITIFEIKTPLPERSVPPCTAGSTTITTIGPVSTAGGGGSSGLTSTTTCSSQHSLSVRSSGSQGSSLFTLNNKQIQLQPISSPLSRSQQIAAQSRGLSITASKQGPQINASSPSQGIINMNVANNRRIQQSTLSHSSPSILLNQHHKVTFAPVRSSINNNVLNKFPMRNLSKFNPNVGSHSHHYGHGHGHGNSGERRLDPLMMLETRMVEEERELNPGIENAAALKKPSVNNILQQQHFIKRAPVNRFTQLQQHQKMPLPPKPLYPQQNRRKPVLIQLVELPDDEHGDLTLDSKNIGVNSGGGTVISTKPVTVNSISSTHSSGSLSSGRHLSKPNLLGGLESVKRAKVQSRPVTSAGRSRVSSRRRKRKRIYSTNKLAGSGISNVSKGQSSPAVKPPKVLTPSTTATVSDPPIPPTTIYRTRTVVKASLAAENQKALEAQIRSNPREETPKLKTIKDIRASIPTFGPGRPWKRHNRKLSTAEQLEQTKKDRYIDLETPRSILTQINPLHKLLTMETFSTLPELYRYQLLKLLPHVDRETGDDGLIRLRDSALNNEFFKKACQQWRQMLSDGELTPEQRYKNRLDAEKDKSKLDPWKVKHFEPIWGQKTSSSSIKVEVGTSASPNSLAPPKPQVYNLRRSPLRSPTCTDTKSSVESSPLDVEEHTETKDKLLLTVEKTASVELEDDLSEEDDDDENDADFDANDEICSEGDDDQEMSCARTTGLVQRSLLSNQTRALTRNRKRSGVEEDSSDIIDQSKKIKVAPPKLSPIQEVQNKLGDVSIKLIPSPKLHEEKLVEKIKQSIEICEVGNKVGNSSSSPQSDANSPSSGGRVDEVRRNLAEHKASAQLQVSPECDKQVHIALVNNAELHKIESSCVDMPSIIVNAPPDLKITPSEKGIGFPIEKTMVSVSIAPTTTSTSLGTRRLRSILSNAPKKDVAIEVNMPETTKQLEGMSSIPMIQTTSPSVVSVPVGTGATLTLIPMSTSARASEAVKQEQQQLWDSKSISVTYDAASTRLPNDQKNCLIPPEIQSILPATLTVVPSDVPRLLPTLKVGSSSGLSSPTSRSSPTLTLVSSPHDSKPGTLTLSGGDVTIIPNVFLTVTTHADVKSAPEENATNPSKQFQYIPVSVTTSAVKLESTPSITCSTSLSTTTTIDSKQESGEVKTEVRTEKVLPPSHVEKLSSPCPNKTQPETQPISTTERDQSSVKKENETVPEVLDTKTVDLNPLSTPMNITISVLPMVATSSITIVTETDLSSHISFKDSEREPTPPAVVSLKSSLTTTCSSVTAPISSAKPQAMLTIQQPQELYSMQTFHPVSQDIPAISIPQSQSQVTSLIIKHLPQSTSEAIIPTSMAASTTTMAQQTMITVSSATADIPKAITTPVMSSSTTTTNTNAITSQPIAMTMSPQSSVVLTSQSQHIVDSSSSSSSEAVVKNQKSRPKSNKVCEVNPSSASSTSTPSHFSSPPTSSSTTTSLPKQASSPETANNKVPRPISTNHPPGQINLERSYQICRAVIQNSPNRDQLQHQLVKPPPVPTKLQQQAQFRMIQGLTQVGDAQMIQVQRRSSTPNVLSGSTTTLPIQLSGVGPHHKVILAHISNPQSPGGTTPQQIAISQSPCGNSSVMHTSVQQPQGSGHNPLIRPVQPGSPIIVRATTAQNQQFMPQQCASTTVITPQQLAMLIQQQHHHQIHQQASAPSSQYHQPHPQQQSVQLPSFINMNQLSRPVSQPSRPNSASSVLITSNPPNPSSSTNSINSNPGCTGSSTMVTNSHKLLTPILQRDQFLRQSFIPVTSTSQSSSHSPIRHQVLHIQKQQLIGNPGSPGSNNSYPLRAQIVTSNGETITIHRAAAPTPIPTSNGPIRVVSRPLSYGFNNGQVVGQGQQHVNKRLPQNCIAISSGSRVPSPGVIPGQIQLVCRSSPGPVVGKQGHIMNVNRRDVAQSVQKPQQAIRLISVDQASNSSSADVGELLEGSLGGTSLNSISNLAEFITNQLAASNIRSISPLTFDQSVLKFPNTSSANVVASVHQALSCNNPTSESGQGIMIITSMPNSSSSNCTTTNAVNSNVISSSSSGSGCGNSSQVSAITDYINCTPTTEVIMDFHDALGSGMDSPYSLISESDSQAIAEIIDLPSHETIVVTSSAPYGVGGGCSSVSEPRIFTNHQGQRQTELVVVSQGQGSQHIFSGGISLKSSPSSSHTSPHPNPTPSNRIGIGNASSFTMTMPSSSLLTSSSNRNLTRLATTTTSTSPLVVSSGGVDGHANMFQTAGGGNQVQASRLNSGTSLSNAMSMLPIQGNPSSLGDPSGGIRQQQYIIVQTTGSNGLPTNLAVPASIVISPQGQLILNNDHQKTPPRASSAPPVQSGNQIIINANHQQSINSSVEGTNVHIGQQHRTISVSSSNGGGTSSPGCKTMSIPTLEIQEGGAVRVVYSGQSSIQHVAVNNNGTQMGQHQRSFTLSQNRTSQISSTTTASQGQYQFSGIGCSSSQQQQQISSSGVQMQQQGSNMSFPNINLNSLNLNGNQTIVQVQVSQAPTIVHQQTINQVLNVTTQTPASINNNNRQISSSWNNGQNSQAQLGQLINVNLNGVTPGSTARIITTTQPGQHPVISIPDTTHGGGLGAEGGGDTSGLLGGAVEFDIFRAIEGMNVKVSGGIGATNSAGNIMVDTGARNIIGSSLGVHSNNSSSVVSNNEHSSEFNGVEEVGQIILDSGGNCVCDLRAMIGCMKCGAFCHADCMGPPSSDLYLCLACLSE